MTDALKRRSLALGAALLVGLALAGCAENTDESTNGDGLGDDTTGTGGMNGNAGEDCPPADSGTDALAQNTNTGVPGTTGTGDTGTTGTGTSGTTGTTGGQSGAGTMDDCPADTTTGGAGTTTDTTTTGTAGSS